MMFLEQGSAKAHVPDVTNEKTFVDFLIVCCLGVSLNVLCHMTYSAAGLDERYVMDDTQVYLWDTCNINGLSEDERKQLCLARGHSIELILWLSMTYSTGIHDTPVQELFARVLVNICKMLCNYKWQADKRKTPSAPNFTVERLKVQIHAVLQWVAEKLALSPGTSDQLDWDARKWKLPMTDSNSQSLLPQVTGLKISKSLEPPYIRKQQSELFKLGETALDKKYTRRFKVKRETIGVSCDVNVDSHSILKFYIPDNSNIPIKGRKKAV